MAYATPKKMMTSQPNKLEPINNTKLVWSLLRGRVNYGAFVCFIMLLAAIAESLGLAMVLPLLVALIDPAQSAHLVPIIDPVIETLSTGVMMLFILGAFVIKTTLQVASRGMSYHFALQIRQEWTTLLFGRFLEGPYGSAVDQAQGVIIQNTVHETQIAARSITQILNFINRLICKNFDIFV